MRTVRAVAPIGLTSEAALELWSDPASWPEFVEGFERVVDLDPSWPQPGAAVVWESRPDGRGRITERVVEHEPGRRLVTDVSEEPKGGGAPRLRGVQAIELSAAPSASSHAELRLDYELLRSGGAPGPLTDLLFVRRALRDALGRTLERFAAEAARAAAR